MGNRRTVIVASTVMLALLAFTTAYLRIAAIGDPFSGTWRLNPGDPYAVVVRLQKGGYFIAVENGQTSSGWVHAARSGKVLTATLTVLGSSEPTGGVATTILVFQSWDGHLVETDHGLDFLLTKMNGSTSLPG